MMKQANKKRYRQSKRKQKILLLFLMLIFLIFLGGFVLEKQKIQEAKISQEAGNDDALQVHFLDVGQADATLISCNGHAMLIDAGSNDKGSAVWHYLKKQGVEKLDYVIGTHPDADHIGGLDVILTKFDCETVMMPEVTRDNATYQDVIMAMEYRRYKNTLPVVGQTYQLGDAVFTIVAPDEGKEEEYNNYSIGILLEYGETRFLFVGDAQEEAEQDMLLSGISIQADVLKAGHHGSSDSCSDAFLDAVNPTCAVISCGRENEYGHPHRRTLNSLKKRGVLVYRTDEQGTIVAQSDGEKISFDTKPSVSWKSGWE